MTGPSALSVLNMVNTTLAKQHVNIATFRMVACQHDHLAQSTAVLLAHSRSHCLSLTPTLIHCQVQQKYVAEL